jgi:hypothetical protein
MAELLTARLQSAITISAKGMSQEPQKYGTQVKSLPICVQQIQREQILRLVMHQGFVVLACRRKLVHLKEESRYPQM